MYLSQILKCICLKLQIVFVSNCKMYFSQFVEIHLKGQTMRIQCRIVAGVAAGLALFTQIQLVLRLPGHRRIDHNLRNTGNGRIHKSGNIQIWDSEDQPNPNSTSPLPPMHGVENSLIISFLAINKKIRDYLDQ